nr:DUF6728 family protein [Mucilaginibacter sp. X5P1]MBB6139080.1 amino acid transporter [Mucilaginibacter sp. X5P1]
MKSFLHSALSFSVSAYICIMYFFRKKDPNRPTSFNLKVMHVINAIAITVFLLGIIWKLIDWFILKRH